MPVEIIATVRLATGSKGVRYMALQPGIDISSWPDLGAWVEPSAPIFTVVGWIVLPLIALVIYMLSETAMKSTRLPGWCAKAAAWTFTLFAWEVIWYVAWAYEQFYRLGDTSVVAVLGTGLGSFVLLTIFARLIKPWEPVRKGTSPDEGWP